MIYIKDGNQHKLDQDADLTMEISCDVKVIAAELTMVLCELHKSQPSVVRAAITVFWKEVQDDSRTE